MRGLQHILRQMRTLTVLAVAAVQAAETVKVLAVLHLTETEHTAAVWVLEATQGLMLMELFA